MNRRPRRAAGSRPPSPDVAGDRRPAKRRETLRLIGRALLVQHRVTVTEKPHILWDRPNLSRLYSRLEDEYELVERADTLNGKLGLIGEIATLLTDPMDTSIHSGSS